MFINQGDMVSIVDGPCRGRFGKLEKIRIEDVSGEVWCFVAVYEPITGAMPIQLFNPGQLMKRAYANAADNEREALAFVGLAA